MAGDLLHRLVRHAHTELDPAEGLEWPRNVTHVRLGHPRGRAPERRRRRVRDPAPAPGRAALEAPTRARVRGVRSCGALRPGWNDGRLSFTGGCDCSGLPDEVALRLHGSQRRSVPGL